MKKAILEQTDKTFDEHLSPMQLALFKENKLNEEEREEVFRHLSQCQQCREVLHLATQIEKEEQKRKPFNNVNYKKYAQLAIASSFAILFFAVPAVSDYPDEIQFKSVEKRTVLEKTLNYWEHRFEDVLEIITQ